jgi:hypothetical protein
VEIVIGTYHLGHGGCESYTLTVAEQLQRLGHGVTILGVQPGPAIELAHDRGLRLVLREEELPQDCDVVYAQDAITAYQLADCYPRSALVVAAHADEYDFCTPPQVPGLVQAVVVLSERLSRHVRSLGLVTEVVRLRQPVDAKRFYPRIALHDQPQRALLLGNWVQADRRRLVVEACAEAGIECRERGATSGSFTRRPELELASTDIVFGKARVIVEAMASGRAAYVFDHNGGDGWVTPERYEVLEADNFGGQAEPVVTDRERLRADLALYDAGMGPANRDLAVANHAASRHAQALVSLFDRLVPRVERADAHLRELSRLTRLQWVSEGRVVDLTAEVLRLRAEVKRLERRRARRALVAAFRTAQMRRAGKVRRAVRDLRRGRKRSAHTV